MDGYDPNREYKEASKGYRPRNVMHTFKYTQNGWTAYVTAADEKAARILLENNPYEINFGFTGDNTYVGFRHDKWDFEVMGPPRHLCVKVEIVSDDKTAERMTQPDLQEV